jgi:hypothetical protein
MAIVVEEATQSEQGGREYHFATAYVLPYIRH